MYIQGNPNLRHTLGRFQSLQITLNKPQCKAAPSFSCCCWDLASKSLSHH